jgi:hypothetical protein
MPPGRYRERTTGFEPATLSLGSRTRAAWINGFHVAMRKSTRSNPLGTATAEWSLARNWRAPTRPRCS